MPLHSASVMDTKPLPLPVKYHFIAQSLWHWNLRSAALSGLCYHGADCGFGKFCPCSKDLFQYRGLCSHSPLIETILGNLDYTEEQLETMAAKAKKHHYEEQKPIRKFL
jgi:hypothetical protein